MIYSARKIIIGIAIVLFLAIPFWIFFATPELLKLPSNFSYKANVSSHDNFYDEAKNQYSGELASKTQFYYEVASIQNNALLIKNVFDVRKPTGERIFSVERLYGVDPKTGMHVKGFGDRDRDGYLFTPKKLTKGQEFVYWHINYDAPATMKFAGEETILGLTTYRYESRYGVDQTKNLGNLPGVPDERGINLDVYLQLWVEPLTGRMVKYEDATIAYYYDIKTKERLHPWNKFGNSLTDASIAEQVMLANQQRRKTFFVETIAPILFGVIGVTLLIVGFIRKRK